MAKRRDIDRILKEWSYEPGEISARIVRGSDGRDVVQMRVEMGVLQLESTGRPDGERPHGAETYFDYLRGIADRDADAFELNPQQCLEADREFMQFYHRRVCWLALREFGHATTDADHTLALMDFVRKYSPNEEWTLSHEQYRPFVMFHRVQASTLARLEESGPDEALTELDRGLKQFQELYKDIEAEEQFEDDDLVQRLHELRETVRAQYEIKPTLTEQMAKAVAAEKYELAAKLRDEIMRRGDKAPDDKSL
jgi:hypothetical protein